LEGPASIKANNDILKPKTDKINQKKENKNKG
jgi:hypothetical protein